MYLFLLLVRKKKLGWVFVIIELKGDNPQTLFVLKDFTYPGTNPVLAPLISHCTHIR